MPVVPDRHIGGSAAYAPVVRGGPAPFAGAGGLHPLAGTYFGVGVMAWYGSQARTPAPAAVAST